MIKLIDKIFIKDSKDNNKNRIIYGITASILGCVINLSLFIIKLIFGLLSNSISVIADAINNLTDIGSCVISFIGFNVSSKPADKEHPFGHQRIEYITGLIMSIIIIVIGIEFFGSSISKIISKEVSSFSYVTIIILFISIILKLYLAFFNKKIGVKINSISLKVSAKDALNDCIATFFVLISAVVSILFNVNIDGYIGVLLSLFIIYSGICLVKETISPLIGEKVDDKLLIDVLNDVKSYSDILGVHDVMCHCYGPNKIFMSLHAEVDAKQNILDIHNIIDKVEFEIKNKYDIALVIHMDPIELDCEVTNNYKVLIINHLKQLNDKLSIHDFRTVSNENNINIIFDILKPVTCKINNLDIEKSIYCLLSDNEVNIKLIISFDEDFSALI